MIYFAQDEATLHIKIGVTEQINPEQRLAQLQTGNPSPIVLLGTMPGDRETERSLHQQFAAARVAGEWFRPVPGLLALMLEHRACQAIENTRCCRIPEDQPWGEGVFFHLDGSWSSDTRLHPEQIGPIWELLCPFCGFDYHHHTDNLQHELSVRGGTTTVSFSGECGHSWSICFGFHKGQMYMVAVCNGEEDDPEEDEKSKYSLSS